MKKIQELLLSWLRKAEKITHTDNLYLAKSIGRLLTVDSINLVCGLLLYILIGHFLPKHVFGEYKYYLSLFNLFSLAVMNGLETSLNRSVARGFDASLPRAFAYRLKMSLIGSGIAGICAVVYGLVFHQINTSLAFVALALLAPLVYAGNLYRSYWNGKKRFDQYQKLISSTTIVSFLLMAAAIFFLRNPVWLFFFFLVTSLTSLVAHVLTVRQIKKDGPADPELIPFGKHLSYLYILGTVANNIDGILIFHLLGPVQLAIYSIAIVPGEHLKGLLKVVQGAAFPKFVQQTSSPFTRSFKKQLFLLFLGTAICVFIFILFTPLFFRLVLPAYIASVSYAQVFSLSLLLGMPATLLFTIFQARGLKKEVAHFTVYSSAFQLLCLMVGAWFFGLWGAIASRILSRAFMFFNGYILLSKHHKRMEATKKPSGLI